MLLSGLVALITALGIPAAAYAAQTHGPSHQVTVEARGGHGGGHGGGGGGWGGGHSDSHPRMQRPNEARDPHGRFLDDGLPGV
jgi:hypothetical protein